MGDSQAGVLIYLLLCNVDHVAVIVHDRSLHLADELEQLLSSSSERTQALEELEIEPSDSFRAECGGS